MERLQKYLAHAGIGSRRSCEEIILKGKVKVNGKIVTTLGTKVNPTRDNIEVNNQLITNKEDKVYLLLNKPDGYVTTVKDPRGRPTVIDLIENINKRIYPVGRLDYETEGLLLLTNDGKLAYRLTHPSYKIDKVYEALVKGNPTKEKLSKLRNGIELEDGITEPAKVKVLKKFSDKTLLEITIHEGRNRQVRRMCRAINHPILNLKRTQIGPLQLGNIPKGNFRTLKPSEIKRLKKAVDLR